MNSPGITRWTDGLTCVNQRWEQAYARFETPDQEMRKFHQRLLSLGADDWPRDWRIADIFCGNGRNLAVLEGMGFSNLSGVDLSPHLLERYSGTARLYLGDATDLHFADHSFDLVMVQGGLHHLPVIPDDLDRCLSEIRRILVPGGRFAAVEPWLTPFLRLAHWCARQDLIQRLMPRLEALNTMIQEEQETYDNWLNQPTAITQVFDTHFRPLRRTFRQGKLVFYGEPRHA